MVLLFCFCRRTGKAAGLSIRAETAFPRPVVPAGKEREKTLLSPEPGESPAVGGIRACPENLPLTGGMVQLPPINLPPHLSAETTHVQTAESTAETPQQNGTARPGRRAARLFRRPGGRGRCGVLRFDQLLGPGQRQELHPGRAGADGGRGPWSGPTPLRGAQHPDQRKGIAPAHRYPGRGGGGRGGWPDHPGSGHLAAGPAPFPHCPCTPPPR